MNNKVVFLDIDGTLTVPGCNVPPDTALKAIKKAQKNGHKIFLCTGRNYDMLSPLLQYGFDGVVASSGAYIRYGEKILFDCPMTDAEKTTVMSVLEQCGIFRTVECLDGSYTDEGFKLFLEEHLDKGGNSELLRWRKQIETSLNIRPMAEYRDQPVYKVVVMSPFMEQIKEAEKLLGDSFHFCIQNQDQYGIVNGEIIKKEYDKGTGVMCACGEVGVSVNDAIAVGDSMNDLEMLQVAGTAICMKNGSEQIKQYVDFICPTVEENGLYTAFQYYHLI